MAMQLNVVLYLWLLFYLTESRAKLLFLRKKKIRVPAHIFTVIFFKKKKKKLGPISQSQDLY